MKKKSDNARKLEEKKAEEALWALDSFSPSKVSDGEINFEHKGHLIKYFPLTEWFTGKTVTDGRGLKNLLKQLKP
jgi:hypothetical protein